MTQAYICPNLITASASLAASGSDAVYSLNYLRDGHAGIPFRFADGSGGWVEIDFGSAVEVGGIALVNHNLTPSATVTLKGGAATNPSTVSVTVPWTEHDTWAEISPAASYRYWRLSISETNPDQTEIGELVLGSLARLSRGHGGGHVQRVARGMAEHETELGVRYSATRWERREWELDWRNVTSGQLAELAALDSACGGSRIPWVWIPDTSSSGCHFVRKQADWAWSNSTGTLWEAGLRLREEHRGSTIEA